MAEDQPYNELTLAQAKNSLLNFINPNISVLNIRELNPNLHNVGLTAHDLFLQVRIIFHTQNDVDHYLENYLTAHGPNRLGELMNRGIPVANTNFRITPLDCATLWSNNDQMVQLLYDWGSTPSFTSIQRSNDMNVEFSNYLANIHYFNHLEYFRLNDSNYNYPRLNNLRNIQEFHDVINQRIWQASEQNRYFPGRRVINILNRRRREHQVNYQDRYNNYVDDNNNYYNR